MGGLRRKIGKRFFFEKKKQKTFVYMASRRGWDRDSNTYLFPVSTGLSAVGTQTSESFLLLFFKKEALAFMLPYPIPPRQRYLISR
jgi:hypothetical protein